MDEMAATRTPGLQGPLSVDIAARVLKVATLSGISLTPYATTTLPPGIDAARLAAALTALPDTATLLVDRSGGKPRPGMVDVGGVLTTIPTVEVPWSDLHLRRSENYTSVPLAKFYDALRTAASPEEALAALSKPRLISLTPPPASIDLTALGVQVALYPRPGDTDEAKAFRIGYASARFINETQIAMRGSEEDGSGMLFETVLECRSYDEARLVAHALLEWTKAAPERNTLFMDHDRESGIPGIIPSVHRDLADVYVQTADGRFLDLRRLIEASERMPMASLVKNRSLGRTFAARCFRAARQAVGAFPPPRG
jgi:hypothetical protein